MRDKCSEEINVYCSQMYSGMLTLRGSSEALARGILHSGFWILDGGRQERDPETLAFE